MGGRLSGGAGGLFFGGLGENAEVAEAFVAALEELVDFYSL